MPVLELVLAQVLARAVGTAVATLQAAVVVALQVVTVWRVRNYVNSCTPFGGPVEE